LIEMVRQSRTSATFRDDLPLLGIGLARLRADGSAECHSVCAPLSRRANPLLRSS
jgi:hypothetical protein